MIDINSYSNNGNAFTTFPIIKPNIRTGEGRTRCRPLSRHRAGDQKKKVRRKMAKKSKKVNRR